MRAFLKAEDGALVLVAAIGMTFLFSMANLVIASSQKYALQEKISHAADAAALAAAIEYSGSADAVAAKQQAIKYYDANLALALEESALFDTEEGEPVPLEQQEASAYKLTEANIDIDTETGVVTVTPTPVTVIGIEPFPEFVVAVTSKATAATSEISQAPLEVSLVVDVTQSMAAGQKMRTVKDSTKTLVETILDANHNASVALVPFNISVRLNTDAKYEDWLNSDLAMRYKQGSELNLQANRGPEKWSGCLLNNLPPADTNDTSWRTSRLIPWNKSLPVIDYYFGHSSADMAWKRTQDETRMADASPLLHRVERGYTPPPSTGGGGSSGGSSSSNNNSNTPPPPPTPRFNRKNEGCTVPAIVPLTQDKETLLEYVESFDNNGYGTPAQGMSGTIGSVGMLWGWRTLSPKWRGEWLENTDASLPRPYVEASKAVVFLTDGLSEMPGLTNGNIFSYGAYGYGVPDKTNCCGRGFFNGTGISISSAILKQYVQRYDWSRYGFTAQTYAEADIELDERLKKVCDNIKQQSNITIYTIGIDVLGQPGGLERAQGVLRYCASREDTFYLSASTSQLQTAFTTITSDILTSVQPNVRLVE